MWVMVSGIKSVEDALKAIELGANALGLVVEPEQSFENCFPSLETATSITKRLLSPCETPFSFQMQNQRECEHQCCSSPTDNGLNLLSESLSRMKNLCGSMLVTHSTDVQAIVRLAGKIGVTIIQLVGDTMPEDILEIKDQLPSIKVVKSVPVVDDSCVRKIKRYIDIVDAIELDTFDAASKRTGGTGKTHDWNISKKIVQEYGWKVPVILAGGLHADNIEKAIQTVKPVGVDVSSGIKDRGSIQNNEKLETFIYKTRCCANVLSRQPDWRLMYS